MVLKALTGNNHEEKYNEASDNGDLHPLPATWWEDRDELEDIYQKVKILAGKFY